MTGAETFNEIGCAACHTPRQQTPPDTERAAEMSPGLDPVLDDSAASSDLQGLYVQVGQLRRQLEEIGGTLGLVRGFNSSDGD